MSEPAGVAILVPSDRVEDVRQAKEELLATIGQSFPGVKVHLVHARDIDDGEFDAVPIRGSVGDGRPFPAEDVDRDLVDAVLDAVRRFFAGPAARH